jgi:hypothetical protein
LLDVVAELRPEPDNPYDANAVAVLVDGHKVGHLSKTNALAYRNIIDRAISAHGVATCSGEIRGGWDRGNGDTGKYGIVLSVGPR